MNTVVGETDFTAGLRAYMCAPPSPHSKYTLVSICIHTHTHIYSKLLYRYRYMDVVVGETDFTATVRAYMCAGLTVGRAVTTY